MNLKVKLDIPDNSIHYSKMAAVDVSPWVKLEGGSETNDEPRLLTEDEINYVVKFLPRAPAADVTAAAVAKQEVVAWIKNTLRQEMICPSAIPELVETMVKQHTKSLVVPGTAIGITAAEAVGASTTQSTLNSFHFSGQQKSATFGIDAMRDLIFARKNPKNEALTIYFLNKAITYEEVLDARSYIVGSVVKDFVADYDIDSPENLPKYWWHDAAPLLLGTQIPESGKVMRLKLNTVEMFKHKVSIAELASVMEREIPCNAIPVYGPISDGIIDLYPNPQIITECLRKRSKQLKDIPAELAELTYLETIVWPDLDKIRVKGISGIKDLYPIVSPVWRMVLSERKVSERSVSGSWELLYNPVIMTMTGLTGENLAVLCELAGLKIVSVLADRLLVSLPDDRFRTEAGDTVVEMSGVKYRQIPLSAVKNISGELYVEYEGDSSKSLPDNVVKRDITRVLKLGSRTVNKTVSKFYRKLVQPKQVAQNKSVVLEVVPAQTKIKELGPGDYVNAKIIAEKRGREEEISIANNEAMVEARKLESAGQREAGAELLKRARNLPRTVLMKAAEFIIAETDGSNLLEIMTLEGIDKERTTCNNMHVIAETLGIEAARNFVIQALSNTIANNNSYVNPAHITFIAEFITSRGEPFGATFTGISRQPGGHLSLSTLERAGKVFTQNALFGRKEDIRNVSAAVMVGERMSLGSGAFDVAQDIVEDGVAKTLMNSDLFTGLERDDETAKLLLSIVSGVSTPDLDSKLEALDNLNLDMGVSLVPFVTTENGKELTNLQDLFNRDTEPISGIPPRLEKTLNLRKVPENLPGGGVGEIAGLARERDFIKVGVPSSRPVILSGGPVVVPVKAVPILSAGLVLTPSLVVPSVSGGIPSELEGLLKQFGFVPERAFVPLVLPPDLTPINVTELINDLENF